MSKCIKKVIDDFEPIFQISQNDKSGICNDTGDLYQLSSKFYDLINIKISFLIFITYYILNTDVFIEKGLAKIFNNVYDATHDKLTEKGIIISGIMLSMMYILYDFLDKKIII
jgi:hypothetical protein